MLAWIVWAAAAVANDLPPLETLTCLRLNTPLQLDGQVDEAWAEADATSAFRIWGAPEDLGTYRTSVRFAYDDDALFILFECEDIDMYCLYEDRDAYLWESDVVELFLVPDIKKPLYYEFQVAPNGALFDARFISRGGGDFRRWSQWDCPMTASIALDGSLNDWTDSDTGYVVEWKIPWSAFADTADGPPTSGTVWRFAAARADFSVPLAKEERTATANLVQGDPHTGREGYFSLAFE